MNSYPKLDLPTAIPLASYWPAAGWTKTMIAVAAIFLANPIGSAADIYEIDPAHSFITFSVRHLGLSNVKGQFREFRGSIVLDKGTVSKARANIQVKSVETGMRQRDDHLRSVDFFDASNYPAIIFETKRIRKNRVYGKRHNLWDGGITVVGNLTMRGVTKELQFSARQSGPARDPWGGMRIGLEARIRLNRKDYGISFQQKLETGALVVGEDVEIEISLQAIRKGVKANSKKEKSENPTGLTLRKLSFSVFSCPSVGAVFAK